MNLKFKKPSKETQMAMSKVAIGEDYQNYYSLAEEKLANATNHQYAKLVNSGNAAILSTMNSIDGAILIPDQGAWNGFKQIANFLNKDLITVKTNQGLIDLNNLNESVISSSDDSIIDLNDENNKSALFLTSFAAYTAEQDMKIATVPIGYADGFIRAYAKNGYMIVNGKRADIVGRICMDQTMIDVTDIDVKVGDEVIVFGSGSCGERTADDLAVCADTINYEVVCNISKRVPRFYVKHEKVTEVMYKI